MGKMMRRSAAVGFAIFVGIACFCLGLLVQRAFDTNVLKSNNCITAFLRLPADETRQAVPAAEVKRVCGTNPEFDLQPATTTTLEGT